MQVASTPVEAPAGDAGDALLFQVAARIVGPLRIGTGNKPEPGSREPLRLLRTKPGGPPVVPGTTLKGVFRSRAEFILRSVIGEPAACLPGTCGKCWTCQVFGYGGGVGHRTRPQSAAGPRSGSRTRSSPPPWR